MTLPVGLKLSSAVAAVIEDAAELRGNEVSAEFAESALRDPRIAPLLRQLEEQIVVVVGEKLKAQR